MRWAETDTDFITGIKEKYPEELLKGRIETEGNVISCFFKDVLLLDESDLSKDDFITKDGRFYYQMLNDLRQKKFHSIDEVTILSNCSESVVERFEEMGGWESVQHLIDIINTDNQERYVDNLFRENVLLKFYDDGFNLLKPIVLKDKKVAPLTILRKMTSEECIDWYEARMSTYKISHSSKVLEEEEIDFDDEFLANCEEGIENGVPFDIAGEDIYGEEMNCFPFLSRQINGFLDETLSMIAGFSSAGKSTWMITVIMALLFYGRKVLIITNEENVIKFKIKFLVWLLAKRNKFFKLSKKKMLSGDITEESKKEFKDIQKLWREQYKGRLKVISISDADIGLVKKKIREHVLRYGYDCCVYDTFKIEESNMAVNRQDLSLVHDSRELLKLARKYNIIMLASVQLAEYMRGKLFLDASCLSNSKQIKETLENLFLMRSVYEEELDPKSKFYCHPFRLKRIEDKWIEEEYNPDPSSVYRILFVEKNRNGGNSSDTGVAYLLKYVGDFCLFKEVAQCRPRHGEIK